MKLPSPDERRLADLLVEPRETLNVELKSWLDITNNNEHKAVLAKAIIALANHGGGFVLIGFEKTGTGSGPASGRPASLGAFNTDAVNSIVSKYCDPKFHCDVSIQRGPDGLGYPIIVVPGGHRVPIRSTRDGPNGGVIKQNSYYIRRIGPASEVPQDGQEWDSLIRRVVANAREDLLDQFRAILAGGSEMRLEPAQAEQLDRWFDASLARWQELASTLPAKDGARLEPGYLAMGYSLNGDLKRLSLTDLKEALRQAKIRHTGWPVFWVPTRPGIAPYAKDGNIECWIGGDKEHGPRDGAHSDFWRVSPEGKAFIIRGFREDGTDYGAEPGTAFEITTPAWLIGEALLHASALANLLGDPQAEVVLVAGWTGLKGRQLAAHPSTNRLMFDGHTTQEERYRGTVTARADEIPTILPELVSQLIAPLYELFDFFQLPASLPAEELAKMRRNTL